MTFSSCSRASASDFSAGELSFSTRFLITSAARSCVSVRRSFRPSCDILASLLNLFKLYLLSCMCAV